MVRSPTGYHQRIPRNLLFILWQFVPEGDLGRVYNAPLDVALGEEIRGAPDPIVEITSSATAQRDRHYYYKKTLYGRHGVKGYWIVDLDAKAVEVFTLGERGFEPVATHRKGRGGVLSSPLLEGLNLKIDLKEVFR